MGMMRLLDLSTQTKEKIMSTLTAFIARNIIAADPNPTYSRLDLLDMPVSGGCYHGRHSLCSDHEAAAACGCGCHR